MYNKNLSDSAVMIDDKTLLNEYLSEAEMLLDTLLTDLDALGRHATVQGKEGRSTGKSGANLVNRVFRSVHSLKGLSGMMGLIEVQSLAHEFEDILDEVRMERLTLDSELAAALQEAGAGLAALVGGEAHGRAREEDFDRFRELLSSIAGRRFRGGPETRAAEAIGLSERERHLLTDYEEHRINVNLEAGRLFYSLAVEFPVSEVDRRYQPLSAEVDNVGELLTTLPAVASNRNTIGFKLIFATACKEVEVRKQLERLGQIERLKPSTWRRAGKALRNVGRIPRRHEPDSAVGAAAALPPGFAQESLQPLSRSVRVELAQIDELSGLAHELAIEAKRLTAMAARFMSGNACSPRDHFDLKQSARRVEREFVELEERLVELRMVSLAQTFTRAARLAGRLARKLGKSVSVELSGQTTQVDKMIVDRIADPMHHILRNAIDHGIETPDERRRTGKPPRGRIRIEAKLEGTRAIIAIEDDGRGVDPEQVRRRAIGIGATSPDDQLTAEATLRLIFRPGFSTVGEVSPVSGRGVGLDAVERAIRDLGGEIRADSERGKGTRFELAVPTTLQMISALIVRLGDWRYAVNVGQIVELIYVEPSDIVTLADRREVGWRGEQIPVIELEQALFPERQPRPRLEQGRLPAFVARVADRAVACEFSRFEGQREIIVKSLGSLSGKFKGVVGAVDLEGGDVALVIDLASLLMRRVAQL